MITLILTSTQTLSNGFQNQRKYRVLYFGSVPNDSKTAFLFTLFVDISQTLAAGGGAEFPGTYWI